MEERAKILLVNDENAFRESIQEALKDDYFVTAAASGEEAAEVMKNDAPNLVILDTQLPGIDGIKTLDLIKEIDKSVPVIIVSGPGSGNRGSRPQGVEAYECFDKPFDLDQLRNAIRETIGSEESALREETCALPLDVENFIRSAIEEEVGKMADLKEALRNFDKKYIKFMVDRYMRSTPRQ